MFGIHRCLPYKEVAMRSVWPDACESAFPPWRVLRTAKIGFIISSSTLILVSSLAHFAYGKIGLIISSSTLI